MNRTAMLSGEPGSSDEIDFELDSLGETGRRLSVDRARRPPSKRRRPRSSRKAFSLGVLSVVFVLMMIRVYTMIGEIFLRVCVVRFMYWWFKHDFCNFAVFP